MKLRVYCKKYNGKRSWCADDIDAPGSPAVGTGRNYLEAIGDWFINNQSRFEATIEVVNEDGKPWKHLCGHQYTRKRR